MAGPPPLGPHNPRSRPSRVDPRPAIGYTQGMNSEQIKALHRIADIESHRAATRLPCWLSAQDLYQEAWVHLLESWHTYDPERGALATWAVRRVRGRLYDLAISQHRWGTVPISAARQGVRFKRGLGDGAYRTETASKAAVSMEVAVGVGIEDEATYFAPYALVDVPRVAHKISRLKSKPRSEVLLSLMLGASPSAIAMARGISREGVHQHRRRGLQELNAWATRTV